MEIEKKKLSELEQLPGNPRIDVYENPEFHDALIKSIKKFGYQEPIVWNKRTNHIVGGNQRWAVLMEMGEQEAEVVVVDLDEKDELAFAIGLNKIVGEWDYDLLKVELEDFLKVDYDVSLTGFQPIDLEHLGIKAFDSNSSLLEAPREILEHDRRVTCPKCGHQFVPEDVRRNKQGENDFANEVG